jgi:hypothetical protein
MKNINRPLGAMEKKQRSFELEIFEAAEGGGHFMFIENPGKFNRRVLQFLSPSLEANQEKQTAELDTLC